MHTTQFLKLSQHGNEFYLTTLPAGILTEISYASVRGQDAEEGAVQRFLSPRRIGSVKNFALAGGDFPNAVILNWQGNLKIDEKKSTISFEVEPRIAQLIDGQHRVAGLEEAVRENADFADFQVPVAIYYGLDTVRCAEIFLAINTEQKPVPRSLVFDLYGLLGDQVADSAVVRAQDIARTLNNEGAPYYGMIKFPGEPPRKGGVALSTAVTSIRPLIEKNGVLDQIGLASFENQSKLILNFFDALRACYGKEWTERANALIYASGFSGALEFLSKRIVPFCVTKKSFTTNTIREAIQLGEDNLILQAEVSGKSGTEAQRYIFGRLDDVFVQGENLEDYEI